MGIAGGDDQIQINLSSKLLILVLMYTHAYSDYVNHILNKSPSKAAYSFTRSSRFPQAKEQTPVKQPFLSANGFEYSDGSRHVQSFQQDPPVISNRCPGKGDKRSRSKSPLQHQRSQQDHQASRGGRQERQQASRRPLTTHANAANRSKSKSPVRERSRQRLSPSKTYTQQLEEIDHVSKNKTLSGYYPTGYELSPSGRYMISHVKNPPAHSFGRSEERYQYMVKSDDKLGPGYYRDFSEFGLPRK